MVRYFYYQHFLFFFLFIPQHFILSCSTCFAVVHSDKTGFYSTYERSPKGNCPLCLPGRVAAQTYTTISFLVPSINLRAISIRFNSNHCEMPRPRYSSRVVLFWTSITRSTSCNRLSHLRHPYAVHDIANIAKYRRYYWSYVVDIEGLKLLTIWIFCDRNVDTDKWWRYWRWLIFNQYS